MLWARGRGTAARCHTGVQEHPASSTGQDAAPGETSSGNSGVQGRSCSPPHHLLAPGEQPEGGGHVSLR